MESSPLRVWREEGGSFGRRALWVEASQALAAIGAVVLFAFAWLTVEGWIGSPAPLYAPASMAVHDVSEPGDGPRTAAEAAEGAEAVPAVWLLDGFNVLHVGLLRGRDRSAFWRGPARAELLACVARFPDPDAEIWVVFDGPRPTSRDPGDHSRRVRVVFSPSADAWLVARVRDAADPERVAVVTGDRRLAGRVRHRGARVVAPGEFLARCGEDGASGR